MKNYKKLDIKDVYPKVNSYQQVSLVKNFIFWVGNISSNKNLSNAVFVRPFLQKGVEAQNLIFTDMVENLTNVFFIMINFT